MSEVNPSDVSIQETDVSTTGRLTTKAQSLKHPWAVVAVLGVVAIITDRIVANNSLGLQWAIFIGLVLVAIFVTVRMERLSPPKRSYWLLLPVILITILYLFRTESYTVAALVLATILSLVWLAISFLNGKWAQYRLREHITYSFQMAMAAISGIPLLLFESFRAADNRKRADQERNPASKTGWAVLRGLLLALPVLGVLTTLLASADKIFANSLESMFAWLGDLRVDRFLSEALLVAIVTYLLFGLFKFALTKSQQSLLSEPDQPLIKPFLGITEASVVLGLVNLLFLAFLAIQFRYFFTGQANVSANGLTYSEYAVRGFFELVLVSCISLGLQWLLAGVTHQENRKKREVFSLLSTVLLLEVGIILISAFQRLSLYEAAYGFTQDRLVAHVFMVFVGLLLLAALWMQWRNAFRHQALVLMSLFVVFALTLGLLNVDRTVVRLNLQKASSDGKLDAQFLANRVSADAVPLMFEYYDGNMLPPQAHEKLGKALACMSKNKTQFADSADPWFAVSLPDRTASRLFEKHAREINSYPFEMLETREEGFVEYGFWIDDAWIYCYSTTPTDH